ncbi:MAG: alpha/beta fold hydrolase [Limimaricola sp.]|uniref:alpha/beta fold hydrolase n=1 Tax=Limimaricola sp. TaxID=2211665 RepID=UPI001DBC8D21|nr:alpha/beta fold hydrolase [Limimaricola sp.]MBI1416520.1 alpha/beta fold hydrolase [Limimaricola sp.]
MTEPILLLPGLMCDSRVFSAQIAALSRRWPVMVAPLGPGERIEEMASAILSAAPAKFALAGLSMGGILAMEVLRRAPERVTRVALMDTTPLAATPVEIAARDGWLVRATAGKLDDAMAGELPADALAPGPGRPGIQAKLVAMWRNLGQQAYLRQARALARRKDQQATLRKVRQPALVLCGAHDRLTPPKRHEFMAELIPFARLAVIESAGHLPTLEAPAEVTRALIDWMGQPLVLR